MASFRRAGTRSQAGGHCHVQARRANLVTCGGKPADETDSPLIAVSSGRDFRRWWRSRFLKLSKFKWSLTY